MKNDTSGPVWQVIKSINGFFTLFLLFAWVCSILKFLNTLDRATDWSMLIFILGIPIFALVWTALTSIFAKAF